MVQQNRRQFTGNFLTAAASLCLAGTASYYAQGSRTEDLHNYLVQNGIKAAYIKELVDDKEGKAARFVTELKHIHLPVLEQIKIERREYRGTSDAHSALADEGEIKKAFTASVLYYEGFIIRGPKPFGENETDEYSGLEGNSYRSLAKGKDITAEMKKRFDVCAGNFLSARQ